MKLNTWATDKGCTWEVVGDGDDGDDCDDGGHFTVYMQYTANKTVDFANNVASVGIYVAEAARGKGKARKYMAYFLRNVCAGHKGFVYVDTDASGGFWAHAGFVKNPAAEDETKAQYGYELRASLTDLRLFCKKK